MSWAQAQQLEAAWWDNCVNTFGEETKQFIYAPLMGINTTRFHDSDYNFLVPGKTVIDIGGGPCSMLLKTVNLKQGFVIDPCDYPDWVVERYKAAGLSYRKILGEDLVAERGWTDKSFDEAWIYNCLQHTVDPEKIIANAKRIARTLRLFEWIDHPTNEMHPHTLTAEKLNEWIGQTGEVETIDSMGATGKCYFGQFKV